MPCHFDKFWMEVSPNLRQLKIVTSSHCPLVSTIMELFGCKVTLKSGHKSIRHVKRLSSLLNLNSGWGWRISSNREKGVSMRPTCLPSPRLLGKTGCIWQRKGSALPWWPPSSNRSVIALMLVWGRCKKYDIWDSHKVFSLLSYIAKNDPYQFFFPATATIIRM